ncbi:hypothetical protein [Paramylibacter kogurei]|nr:hypothetical protein [Amylibacter kogurei]
MTDAGEFERLATSVLRIADPLYEQIVHTGVNTSGQTIVDPLDGISICQDATGISYAIACEHTITARPSLSDKWLDPTDGDLIKAIRVLKSFKEKNPSFSLRVVLTSKIIPPSKVVQDAKSEAAKHSVELDVWSNDRLSNVLDVHEDGQSIRSKFFGTDQTRLSRDLADEISQWQLSRHAPLTQRDQLIVRDVRAACPSLETISSSVVYLNGSSGAGKSAFCHQLCSAVVDGGGLGFIVTHDVLERTSSLAQAIRESLVAEVPSLALDDPVSELTRLSQGQEVQIWIEDINLSTSPTDLISKLDRSARELDGSKNSPQASPLKVLCPIWPENLRALPTEVNKVVQSRVADLTDFSDHEAREAIQKRRSAAGVELTNVEADEVREDLGNDPLLIGLWTGHGSVNASEVLSEYVANCLLEISKTNSRSVYSLRQSVISIAAWMLENRTNDPSFDQLSAEFESTPVFGDMEAICGGGSLFREVYQGNQSKLGFRHDRVRDFLLIEAISNALKKEDYSHDYLSDPFYSDLVARASVRADIPVKFWEFAKSSIPLICFGALKHCQRGNPSIAKRLLNDCEELVDAGLLENVPKQIRWAIEWQISGLQGSQFKKLIETTKEDTHAGREARVLNGDVKAAANLCYRVEPSSNAPFRDRLIAHARARHGTKWLEGIAALVGDTTNTEKQREAALYLAGECADERLAESVAECWNTMKDHENELSHGMLFAAVSCLSGFDEQTLEDVFKAWEALPTEDPEGKDKSGLSDRRYNVAKYCLAGGLRRVCSDRTLEPLIQLATNNEDMGHVVYACLEQIDHPLAAVFVASYIAGIDQRVEGKKGWFNSLASSRFGLFGSDMDHNVRYSRPALLSLKTDWEKTENEFFFRKRCFQLWRASTNVKQLQLLSEYLPKGLEEELLLSRCHIGDITAIPELRAKIEERRSNGIYWFQFIRKFDSRLFEDLILQKLEEVAVALKTGEKPDYRADRTITDILAERRDEFAESTIIKHWEDLQHRYNYPHVLLCIATPATLRLHARHFEGIEDKEDYFKLLSFAYGFRNPDRSGITEVTQLKAFEPYLDHFKATLIDELWDECNNKGFIDWRIEHLDKRLSEESWAFKQINDEAAFRDLDEQLANGNSVEMAAYSWSSIRRRDSNSPWQLIDTAVRYVQSRASSDAAEFFAELLALIGTRDDLKFLSKQVSAGLLTQEQYEGTVFAVQKRSLI